MLVWLKRLVYLSGLFLTVGAMLLFTMPVQFMVIQGGVPEAIRIGTVTGTLQSGGARDFVYSRRLGQIDLQQVSMDLAWNWCPGWSQGVLAWCVEVESPLVRGEGRVAYALLTREYRVFDASLDLQVQGYPVNFQGIRSRLKGMGSIRLQELLFDLKGTYLKELIAEGEWKRSGTPEFELGDYLWHVNLEPDGTLVSGFSGGSKDFEVKGQASLDLQKKAYRYSMDVMTENASLLAFLRGSASKSEDGTFTLSDDGKF